MIIDGGSYVAGGLTKTCAPDGSEGYSYNQGVILGGLALLRNATPGASNSSARAALLSAAEGIALGVVDDIRPTINHVGKWLNDPAGNGVLIEPCEYPRRAGILLPGPVNNRFPGCNADAAQFKGIFVRYLRYYLDIVGDASPNRQKYLLRVCSNKS